MKYTFLLFALLAFACNSTSEKNKEDFQTEFERSEGKRSAPYEEGIEWWKNLADNFKSVSIHEYGMTDAGYPLHVVILAKHEMLIEDVKNSKRTTVLVNNAIHPGEPDGVDASMMLYRDILFDDDKKGLLDDAVFVCIPYYNIGGALNRNSHTRANQEGPEEYGFRGNAQNLDLNRDFIKCDSRNARSFSSLLMALDPDMYVETHVSNGADYQYTMTYLATQPDKLGYEMGRVLADSLIPELEASMKNLGDEMAPYINHFGGPLDSSYFAFYDSPRYSTGLTTLHQIFGFITETHMLKPFDGRVRSTYNFLWSLFRMAAKDKQMIKHAKDMDREGIIRSDSLPLDWTIDSSRFRKFGFLGYEYAYETSKVTGGERFRYLRDKPITKNMTYYDHLRPTVYRTVPQYYILKHGYQDVIERLRLNGVQYSELEKDSSIVVTKYTISNLETSPQPYEKHYVHSQVTFDAEEVSITFRKGDYLIPCDQGAVRFLVETLEPDAPDSYFAWNFFDAVLQQKEWYSSYVFEDKAWEYLQADSSLKREFNEMRSGTPGFADNPQWQLYWIYQHSPHYEKVHMVLPVYRIEKD